MAVLYLIPSYLGEDSSVDIFSIQLKDIIENLNNFVAENEKSARKFIKFINPKIRQSELFFSILDKRSTSLEIEEIAKPLKEGKNVGLISEAGLPCIADPGNLLVQWAHNNNVKVVPINGPSSIILALISSGMNGQNFTFNGYLPIDKSERKKSILQLENLSKNNKSAQIFMETPYRNITLFDDLKRYLNAETKLCIASNITLSDENIKTMKIKQWKKAIIDINKKPTIFIIQY